MNAVAEKIRESITIEDILKGYGYPISQNRRIRCPIHHPAENPTSFRYEERSYKCYSCGAYGGVIQLVMDLFGVDYHDAVNKIIYDFSLSISKTKPTRRDVIENIRRREMRALQAEEAARKRKAYLNITKGYQILQQKGYPHSDLIVLEDWLDEHIDFLGK